MKSEPSSIDSCLSLTYNGLYCFVVFFQLEILELRFCGQNVNGFSMFTGLIQGICTVKSARMGAGAMVLTVDLGKLAGEAGIGDSIAINGVCLTVSKIAGSCADFEVSGETLARSTISALKSGSKVNAEAALKPTDRFGGHFVQGHIDGTATIKHVQRQGEFADIEFAAGPELLDQMVAKGSVAVDGVSLTIAAMGRGGFTVAVIPQTLHSTTLGIAKAGDSVNIETDIIVKTVKKQLENILPQKGGLSVERLKELGF
ncbi:MAG: riboflavin synthase [Planctomycetota bacterium]|jgi:riboflavin synthase